MATLSLGSREKNEEKHLKEHLQKEINKNYAFIPCLSILKINLNLSGRRSEKKTEDKEKRKEMEIM